MTSILRKVVAGPRAPHPEANLDLCYVTDNSTFSPFRTSSVKPSFSPSLYTGSSLARLKLTILAQTVIATSGPSATYPSLAYRNPLPALVRFLDAKHGPHWAIWEFRAEGTGYPDHAVYGRIWHYPWPDHHPPPFKLVPGIMASMRDWLRGEEGVQARKSDGVQVGRARDGDEHGERVAVVHCKAGKGRSGSMAVSYLLSEEGWSKQAALRRFTDRRMRPGFGPGISIPSQLRWIDYVERWAACGKVYVEQSVEVVELHVWGLREGVKLAVEGYVDEGKTIKSFHVFQRGERDDAAPSPSPGVVDADADADAPASADKDKRSDWENQPATADAEANPTTTITDVVTDVMRQRRRRPTSKPTSRAASPSSTSSPAPHLDKTDTTTATANTVFRPSSPLLLPTNDINLTCERRARASYGWSLTTSVAHVWFNCFFEGAGPENMAAATPSRHPSAEQLRRNASDASASSRRSDRPPGPDAAPTPRHVLKTAQHNLKAATRLRVPSRDRAGRAPDPSGVFHTTWAAMDGIKGSSSKGARAFDRASVVWRVVPDVRPSASPVPGSPSGAGGEGEPSRGQSARNASVVITEPGPDDEIVASSAADWTGGGVAAAGGQGGGADADSDEDGAEGVRRGVVGVDHGRGAEDAAADGVREDRSQAG